MDPISVNKGDNLTKIARRYDTTVEELLKLNPQLKDRPNTIFVGEKINLPKPPSETPYPGLGVEMQNDEIPKAPWQEGGEVPPKTAAQTPAEESGSNVEKYAGTALALKGMAKSTEYLARGYDLKYVKDKAKDQIKGMKTAYKRGSDKLKGMRAKAKAQSVRNSAAGKIRNARVADAQFKAEQAKLQELKAKQAKVKAAKARLNKLNSEIDAKGNKITDKKLIEKRKANKKAGLERTKKEIDRLQKEIDKQADKVGKAKAQKVATQEAAKSAKRAIKNTPGATNAARKTARKAAQKATSKAVAKSAGKALGKTALKKVPVVGLVAGLFFAADRAMHGDITGAVGEVASGAASCVPGVGTAVSVGIDVALATKDLHNQKVI